MPSACNVMPFHTIMYLLFFFGVEGQKRVILLGHSLRQFLNKKGKMDPFNTQTYKSKIPMWEPDP